MLALYKPHIPEGICSALEDVLVAGQLAAGPAVEEFNVLFSNYIGNPLVSLNSDVSSALTIALYGAGVRPGDEVVMSPMVCLSTSTPVSNLFAKIRWCDVDPLTGNLDPKDVAKKVTDKTKAIIAYHWAGNPVELDALHAVSADCGVPVIEDAGEALGAQYRGKRIGSTGSPFTVFSFYPNRQITTIDGAAIAFSDIDSYEASRWLGRYGIHKPSFRHADGEINPLSKIPVAGWNSYMNQVSASVGVQQMQHLSWIVNRHQENGQFYDAALRGRRTISTLRRAPESLSGYWVYTFLAEKRDGLLRHLRNHGVFASKVHLRNDAYACFGKSQSPLPGVDYFAEHCLSVPCGWWVAPSDRERVADLILGASD
jgi:perosamine synthetase